MLRTLGVRCLTASLLVVIALAEQGLTSFYKRPDRSEALPLTHERLVGRKSNEPEQIHIALAGEGEMTVSWVTPKRDKEANTRVHYWLGSSTSNGNQDDHIVEKVAVGSNETYSCGSAQCPAGYASGVAHHALLKELRPDTTYFYRCASTWLSVRLQRARITLVEQALPF